MKKANDYPFLSILDYIFMEIFVFDILAAILEYRKVKTLHCIVAAVEFLSLRLTIGDIGSGSQRSLSLTNMPSPRLQTRGGLER